jgi:hypothetical protein
MKTRQLDFQSAAESAAQKAKRKQDADQDRFVPPAWDDIRGMLPDPQDQATLDELIKIVGQATSHNERVAALVGNINRVADALVKVMEQFR